MTDQPLSVEDAACLRMLAGANFGADANITLPSGRTITPDEAQALTSAYASAVGADQARPHTDMYLRGGGDPGNERAMEIMAEADQGAARREAARKQERRPVKPPAAEPTRPWWKQWLP